jgi:hypothetical protein
VRGGGFDVVGPRGSLPIRATGVNLGAVPLISCLTICHLGALRGRSRWRSGVI